ncbi:hypothetical protein CEXT_416871 [Caerostris extrusa]|uniref:Uncharacterized protein n=1 Tax=Caerostris extrusa TaxID=172846 RepID=A0AAV4U409_CAEEX|nr:hypothetical protein CEXT_416871 [Caerostris extrusa]
MIQSFVKEKKPFPKISNKGKRNSNIRLKSKKKTLKVLFKRPTRQQKLKSLEMPFDEISVSLSDNENDSTSLQENNSNCNSIFEDNKKSETEIVNNDIKEDSTITNLNVSVNKETDVDTSKMLSDEDTDKIGSVSEEITERNQNPVTDTNILYEDTNKINHISKEIHKQKSIDINTQCNAEDNKNQEAFRDVLEVLKIGTFLRECYQQILYNQTPKRKECDDLEGRKKKVSSESCLSAIISKNDERIIIETVADVHAVDVDDEMPIDCVPSNPTGINETISTVASIIGSASNDFNRMCMPRGKNSIFENTSRSESDTVALKHIKEEVKGKAKCKKKVNSRKSMSHSTLKDSSVEQPLKISKIKEERISSGGLSKNKETISNVVKPKRVGAKISNVATPKSVGPKIFDVTPKNAETKISNVATPPFKQRGKNYSPEAVTVPFSLGWMRELVHRSTEGKGKKKCPIFITFLPKAQNW